MNGGLQVSLVVPVYNESETISDLLSTISDQTTQPEEIIIVDGGSTDNTADLIASFKKNNPRLQLIRAGRAMPGEGRNIGTAAAKSEWIAYTDAGIKLDKYWLEELKKAAAENPETSIVYGNYTSQVNSFFDKCATISYVDPQQPGTIRGRSIVSCLLKKNVWEKAGGFPEWRASEDLIFMEKAEALGVKVTTSPNALAKWQLQSGFGKTFRKFDIYSKYNVWAGRQAYWHYGVIRHYFLMLLFVVAGFFFQSWYFFLAIPIWMAARAAKRIIIHRYQFGMNTLFHPGVFLTVISLLFVIDMATFSGWIKALRGKSPKGR